MFKPWPGSQWSALGLEALLLPAGNVNWSGLSKCQEYSGMDESHQQPIQEGKQHVMLLHTTESSFFLELCHVYLNEKTSFSYKCNRHNSHLYCFNFHSMGAPVMVELEGQTDPLQIAMKELK